MSEIVYPQGCKPIREDLGPDELIRRLKNLTHTLQTMSQDESKIQIYVPLAIHLSEDYYLTHSSRDVQLLIACCIADILRVFAPDAPYKDADQIKTIFLFLIRQLEGLRDPKDPAFKRYFYLLENLAYVKSFNMCFEIEDSQTIFCNLFSLFFRIVNDEHSGKVKSFMLDVLSPLITESDNVSTQLLDIILINIVEPQKSSKKNAYFLAKELIIRTHETMEQYIQQFFNQVLVMDKVNKNYQISTRIYDLIYELNVIHPSILLQVLPQLECKLKSGSESERLKAVALLARMFSEKGSTLAKQYSALWRQFIQRFCDIAVPIRVKCVQSSMHFLLNHPELRDEIIEALKFRQHDGDEIVRYEVVMSIVETAKRDFRIVSESEDLLEFVKERTLDKKFKIRKEAMSGLALIYKKYLSDVDVPEATKKAINWIKDKILHGYYMTGLEDRLLVERLLITCLVPYQLPAEDRMKKLYQLLGTIDDNAIKAFIELQKNQLKVRKSVSDWVKLHRAKEITPKIQKDLNTMCQAISKQLPDPVKAQEFLQKFSQHLRKDATLLRDMETILRGDVSCKECADTMSQVLKKLGQPIMTNLYYNTVKMLLERIASVMVDKSSIEVLVGLIEDCMNGGSVIEEVGLPPESAGERGLKLLSILAYVFSAHFQHDSILRHMIGLLSFDDEYVAPYILKALTYLGRYKPLIECHAEFLTVLAPLCKELALTGTPKQAKHAIRCMYVNTQLSTEDEITQKIAADLDIFPEIVESFKHTLDPTTETYRTAIVALGHIAYNMPTKFVPQIKNIISRKIVKELLVKDGESNNENQPAGDWCEEERLPEETKCKVEALKTMARWLLGLKQDVLSAQKTFRMLTAFIKQHGDLLQSGNLSAAEMSWLRLSAGKAMLKICEQKGVGDQFSAEQFYMLSTLMIDPVTEIREQFAKKLHKGLNKGIPHKCLPLDFMGFYALGGREHDRRLQKQLKTYIETDVSRRRDYLKTYASVEKAMSQMAHILPDYMLVYAVPVLTHDPNFTVANDPIQLKQIEKCLWLILEPLITNREFFCFGFYKNLIQRMKNHRDAFKPDDPTVNHKMYVICDLAMHIIITKSQYCDVRDFTLDARIPSMYYIAQPDTYQNTQNYLPELYLPYNSNTSNAKKTGIVVPTTRKVLRADDQTATSSTSTTSPTSSALTIQAANQSINTTTSSLNTSSNDIDDEMNGKESAEKSITKDNNQSDENIEPPVKRLRTRAATASSNHK